MEQIGDFFLISVFEGSCKIYASLKFHRHQIWENICVLYTNPTEDAVN